ncbi:hypothetical protein ACIQH6_02220 [Micromonospora orduensis]|uniref:hypothetical protein n=1 Tax=Micromonospora orduensis TaxID=1420891 RepID=UPI00382005D2
MEREVRSIQGLLPDNEGVNERLYEAGHSTILTASGVTPSLLGSLAEDEECRRVIAEAVEAVNEAEKFHAELALLASGVLVQLSNDVIGALWQLVGMGEELQSVEKIGKAHDSARKCREAFQAEARTILGVDPEPKKNGSSKGWRRLPQRVVSD